MKVLLCHAYYQQRGGEDLSFEAECRLLESRGHPIVRYTVRNDQINQMTRIGAACRTVWNRDTAAELRGLLRRERPDVVHFTNTFPLLSPAVYYAARAERVPVVQSLRNYRMMCPAALFLREGKICEDCLGKSVPYPAIVHGCYRESRLASTVVAGMLTVHRLLDTWRQAVDLYFTPSRFARDKHIEAGLPPERITVKPNFLDPDPGPGAGAGNYALFVGRLSPEKGLDTLLKAWQRIGTRLPLRIVGDGPLRPKLEEIVRCQPGVTLIGSQNPQDVLRLMQEATCLVMPSVWYETFGRTIIEAYACGTPVLASRLGAMAELVVDERTGFTFTPGDADDLSACVERLLSAPGQWQHLRQAARQEYLERYTAERNYPALMEIYQQARVLARPRQTP